MNITMTITADNTAELFASIKDAAALLQGANSEITAPPVAPASPVTMPPIAPASPVTMPSIAPASPITATYQMPSVGQMPPAPPPVPPAPVISPAVPLSANPTYSIDQIAKAGAELAQAGKMNELLALLQQFGIQAVTQLKPEQIGPFATSLRGLGAQL